MGRSLLARASVRPAFWAWLALSALPPELLSRWMGWEVVDPGYLAVSLLWWPLDLFGRLAALKILLQQSENGAERAWQGTGAALGAALGAEILLALRISVLGLAGLVPALALFSLIPPPSLTSWGWRLALLALALAGLIPCALYGVRRLLTPLEVLAQPLNASQALDASARRVQGKLGPYLALLLPWLAGSWLLDGLGLVAPDSLSLALMLPSLALSLVPLALCADL